LLWKTREMSPVGHPTEQIPNTRLVFPLDQSARYDGLSPRPVRKISNQTLYRNLTTDTASIISGTRFSFIKTASNVRSRGSSIITVIRLPALLFGTVSRSTFGLMGLTKATECSYPRHNADRFI
jgi:hypothetical protein